MKKRILAALLTVIMTMTVICVPNVIAEATNNDEVIKNDEMGIPDDELFKEIIAEADKNEDGFLTVEEAEDLTELHAIFREIEDLQGIESLINLQHLDLRHNSITDIDVLSNLEYLNLEGNPCETEKPTEPGTPDDSTTPETPSTPEQPSNPNTPEIEDAPVIESYTDTQVSCRQWHLSVSRLVQNMQKRLYTIHF